MYYEYPIEQLARSARTRFQLGFARITMKLLPSFDDVVFEPSVDGLRMLAASETALSVPSEIIRQIHADEVDIGKPSVRLLYEGSVREPIMWVRASVRHADAERVLQDLVAREARIEEVDWGEPRTIVRARAPLRKLLGYAKALSALTPGADSWIWLSHYQTLPQGPDGHAA